MAAAGALDPDRRGETQRARPAAVAGVRPRDRARRHPRDLRGNRPCDRRRRLRAAGRAAARRLGAVRRGGRLSRARRDRLPRAGDHAAGTGQAVRRALSRRRRARDRQARGGRRPSGGGTGRAGLDAARQSARARSAQHHPSCPRRSRRGAGMRARPAQAAALLSRAARQAASRGPVANLYLKLPGAHAAARGAARAAAGASRPASCISAR